MHAGKQLKHSKIIRGHQKLAMIIIITEDYSDLSDYVQIWPTRLPALVFAVKPSKHDDSELNVNILGRADKHDDWEFVFSRGWI